MILYSRIYKLKIERAEKEEINNENEEFNFLIHFLEGIKDLLLREYVQRFQVPGFVYQLLEWKIHPVLPRNIHVKIEKDMINQWSNNPTASQSQDFYSVRI